MRPTQAILSRALALGCASAICLAKAAGQTAPSPNDASDAVALSELGYNLAKKGDLEQVITALKAATRLNTNDATAFYNLGKAYFLLRDLDAALTNLTFSINLNSRSPAAYTLRGMVYAKKGAFRDALADYDRALAIDSSSSRTFNDRGLLFLELGLFPEAVQDFTRASGLNPGDSRVLCNRANAHRGLGDWASAREDLERAIGTSPSDPRALNDLAWLMSTCPEKRFRDKTEAVRLAKRACELTKWSEWRCLGTLAAAYANSGAFEKAIEYQSKALDSGAMTESNREQAQQRLALYKKGSPFREPAVKLPAEGTTLKPRDKAPP